MTQSSGGVRSWLAAATNLRSAPHGAIPIGGSMGCQRIGAVSAAAAPSNSPRRPGRRLLGRHRRHSCRPLPLRRHRLLCHCLLPCRRLRCRRPATRQRPQCLKRLPRYSHPFRPLSCHHHPRARATTPSWRAIHPSHGSSTRTVRPTPEPEPEPEALPEPEPEPESEALPEPR